MEQCQQLSKETRDLRLVAWSMLDYKHVGPKNRQNCKIQYTGWHLS